MATNWAEIRTVRRLNLSAVHAKSDPSGGFSAASAVYRHFKMDPDDLDLRDYLFAKKFPVKFTLRENVDRLVREVLGRDLKPPQVTPQAVFASLYWDGFDLKGLTIKYRELAGELQRHLHRRKPALVLVDEGTRWATAIGINAQGLWLVESRHREPELVDHREAKDYVNGAILVSRTHDHGDEAYVRDMQDLDYVREYCRGVWFLFQAHRGYLEMAPRAAAAELVRLVAGDSVMDMGINWEKWLR